MLEMLSPHESQVARAKEHFHQYPIHLGDRERPTRKEDESGVEADIEYRNQPKESDEVLRLLKVSVAATHSSCA